MLLFFSYVVAWDTTRRVVAHEGFIAGILREGKRKQKGSGQGYLRGWVRY